MHSARICAVCIAVLSVAALADGQQCPTKEDFSSCAVVASEQYKKATDGVDRTSTCFKKRACEYLKDLYFCAAGDACCPNQDEDRKNGITHTDAEKHIRETLLEANSQLRPLGVLQACDAVNPCVAGPLSEPALPAGCCPMAKGALDSQRVCCQSPDCSMCDNTVGQFVLDNQIVPTDVYIRLEATQVGSMCPDGDSLQNKRQGFVCNKRCSANDGGMLASTNNDYIMHELVSASVPTTQAECPDCCVLSFDSPDDLPCATGCRRPDANCHVCSKTGLKVPPRCNGYADATSCAQIQTPDGERSSRCVGHQCMRWEATLTWYLHERVRVAVMAPRGKMYEWKPAVSGWLIMRYQIRFEKDRRTCCPYSLSGEAQSCCGGLAFPGTFCAGEETCRTDDGKPDGQCSADCDCPFGVQLSHVGAHPDPVEVEPWTGYMQQACWASSGLTSASTCRVFEVNLPFSSANIEVHAMTGFSSIRPLRDVLAEANPSLARSTPALQRVQVLLTAEP